MPSTKACSWDCEGVGLAFRSQKLVAATASHRWRGTGLRADSLISKTVKRTPRRTATGAWMKLREEIRICIQISKTIYLKICKLSDDKRWKKLQSKRTEILFVGVFTWSSVSKQRGVLGGCASTWLFFKFRSRRSNSSTHAGAVGPLATLPPCCVGKTIPWSLPPPTWLPLPLWPLPLPPLVPWLMFSCVWIAWPLSTIPYTACRMWVAQQWLLASLLFSTCGMSRTLCITAASTTNGANSPCAAACDRHSGNPEISPPGTTLPPENQRARELWEVMWYSCMPVHSCELSPVPPVLPLPPPFLPSPISLLTSSRASAGLEKEESHLRRPSMRQALDLPFPPPLPDALISNRLRSVSACIGVP